MFCSNHIKFQIVELNRLNDIILWTTERMDLGYDVHWDFSFGKNVWICVPESNQELMLFLSLWGNYVAAGPNPR
jgi:hypothetical protein